MTGGSHVAIGSIIEFDGLAFAILEASVRVSELLSPSFLTEGFWAGKYFVRRLTGGKQGN